MDQLPAPEYEAVPADSLNWYLAVPIEAGYCTFLDLKRDIDLDECVTLCNRALEQAVNRHRAREAAIAAAKRR